jgi:hypothetical protein
MALMRRSRDLLVAASAMAVVFGFAWSAAAQATTATVAGTVKDAQGVVIAGVTVTLVSESRGTAFKTQSSITGDFVVPNIPGDTYTVRAVMDGFKTSERTGVTVSPGERAAVGTVTMEVGALAERVTFTDAAPMTQAQTGDRSFTVTTDAVENLPIIGRDASRYAGLTPGVVSTISSAGGVSLLRADGARSNYLLDGVATVDPGSSGAIISLNPDAIAQVRVVSSAYQAEYGRTTGMQIVSVTKSGSNRFRGSVYDIERRTAWNKNTWANTQNGNPKPAADQRDWGFTIGGPVGKPGGSNKLFFFFSEQVQPRSTGRTVNYFRVPTLLERQGDFSQSTDQNGNLFNLILDATTGLSCTAADTRGCFRDGGVLGRIPQDGLYDLGLRALDRWPLPNAQGVNYNLQTDEPVVDYNTLQHVIRMDWQASSKLRVSAKYAGQNNAVYVVPGRIPGWNDATTEFPSRLIPSVTVDYVLNFSMVLEGTWGLAQRTGGAGSGDEGGGVMITPQTNRDYFGLGAFPTLFPDPVVPVGSFQERMLKAVKTPMYVNGRIHTLPQMSWGNRIANAPPNTAYPSYINTTNTKDLAISLTQLWGSHTFKFGYQSQDALKKQNVSPESEGVFPPEGLINFGNDSNNPLDTGFGFANAALGVFSSYQQLNGIFEGKFLYHNKDFYLQDNWKVNRRLTLDYGLRFTHHGPQYDARGQASNFFPEEWEASQAPLLYLPGCSVNVTPCPTLNRVAVNPATAEVVPSAAAIGTIVPNTGNWLNGIRTQGDGIAKTNYIEPDMGYGPRFGFAYDVTGSQNMVVRGSMGYFFDRVTGNTVFAQSGNPPTGRQASLYYSTLPDLAAGTATVLEAPPTMNVYYYDADIGSSLAFNGGVQMLLPGASSLDISYVGTRNYNGIAFGAISTPAGELPMDRNAPDIGTAYLPQYQDPTRGTSSVPGAMALTTDLLRPYRGMGPVNTTWPMYRTSYDSVQFAFSRRMRNGWSAGASWALGLRFTGNTLSPQHIVHNADGTTGFASYQKANDDILNNVGLRRHLIRANFVWQIPTLPAGSIGAAKVLAAVVNGWQLSGVVNAQSGARYDATYSYQSNGSNVNLTGSPNYRARIKVNGDTGSGCSSNQYTQYNAGAYQGPTYNSIGNESGTSLLGGCFEKTVDLSLARTISLGGSREVQFRLDAFNVFNLVNYNARSATIQYPSPAAPTTIRNNQYNADGSLNAARLKPNTAGAGAATGAMALRSLQVQVRFYF